MAVVAGDRARRHERRRACRSAVPQPWPAPGKLNLFLHVVGRRPDGYHLLQTAFQFIDLCDEIRFWQRPAGVVERRRARARRCAGRRPRGARGASAADPSRKAESRGVAIERRKKLPMQGGVGGGSSDAATVAGRAESNCGEWGCPSDALAELGLELGADVPVFVRRPGGLGRGRRARCSRRSTSRSPGTCWSVRTPRSATAEVFKAPELTRDSPVITIRGFLTTGGRNDCEPVVRRRYPAVAEALDWLGRVRAGAAHRHRLLRVRGDAGRAGGASGARAACRRAGRVTWCAASIARRSRSAGATRAAGRTRTAAADECVGVSPSGKAAGFDPAIRRFESFHPSQPAAAGDDDEESGNPRLR